MKKNEVNSNEASGGDASCQCDRNRGTNKAVIVIGVILLLGFAFFVAYSRMNPCLSESERLLRQADKLFEKGDYAEAAKLMRQSAELGNSWGQMYYGGCLKKGIGVEQDMPAAVEWFRKSADQGYAVACYELGVCYENGEGVAQDFNEAAAWYKKALDGGITSAAQEALDRVGKRKE